MPHQLSRNVCQEAGLTVVPSSQSIPSQARWNTPGRRCCEPFGFGTVQAKNKEGVARSASRVHKLTTRAAVHAPGEVTLAVEKAARNVRRIYANVHIAAPVEAVWDALTDYEGLGNFIPGLAENRCLERRPQGAKLLQVGEQTVALGAKFRAAVLLDIQEYATGVPPSLCFSSVSNGTTADAGIFPEPRSGGLQSPAQDIAFSMLEGDFTAFRGIWRMQMSSPSETLLSYSLHVQPQQWLPVRLIQSRIEEEVKTNLRAVRDYSERQWLQALAAAANGGMIR